MNEKDRIEVMALIQRRSIPEPNTGCWLWDAASDQDGYGKTKWRGQSVGAHRLSFQAFTNADPAGGSVMHSCDVACCVNPHHLTLGSTLTNLQGAAAKGRMGRGRRSWNMSRGASTTHDKAIVTGREVTQQALHEVLSYDAATGIFMWLERLDDIGWTRKMAGKEAGSNDRSVGYRRIGMFGREFWAHRLAWLYVHGRMPYAKHEIDHINGDKLDNRIENLREVSHGQNGQNTGLRVNNRSGIKGVSWAASRGNWLATITVHGKMRNLGRFDTLEDAAAARRAAEIEYHGDHRRQGDK